jgi:hypothetical protein
MRMAHEAPRRGVTPGTKKRLFTLSGNRCAFEGCPTLLESPAGAFVGEACHIKGDRPGSARYDENQSGEERNWLANLIAMCSTHHTVIDAPENRETYSAEYVVKLKARHEAPQQDGRGPTGSISPSSPKPRSPFPDYLEHDGVLWVDDGDNYFGTSRPIAGGPLCPADNATLRYRRRRDGKDETKSVHNDDLIVRGDYGTLLCPECDRQYRLGTGGSKKVGESRDGVEDRFKGRRRVRGGR